MNTYNNKLKKLFKRTKSNSGFTLTELLTGLVMSVFVTGALGFGLIQVMNLSRRGAAQAQSRNEANRAIEFISSEIRRARTLDTDLLIDIDGDGTDEDLTPPTTVEATGPEGQGLPAGIDIALALDIPNFPALENNAIVYYLQSNAGTNWQGPQVLYRYGPPLAADGTYTNGDWQREALIDGIAPGDNVDCNGTSTANPGFLACIAANNTSAQIFLAGGVDADNDGIINTASSNDKTVVARTQTVARAKDAVVDNTAPIPTSPIAFRSLEADYSCHPTEDASGNPLPAGDPPRTWTTRIDFDNTAYRDGGTKTDEDRNNTTPWIHERGRQPQPIDIVSSNDLTIFAIPLNQTSCLNDDSGNPGAAKDIPLANIVDGSGNPKTGQHAVSHTIKLQTTVANRTDDASFWATFNGDTDGGHDNPNVTEDGQVVVLKDGSRLEAGAPVEFENGMPKVGDFPAPLYAGYDFDNDGNPDRPSLGRFLYERGFATPLNSSGAVDTGFDTLAASDPNLDPDGGYEIANLDSDERIVAIEIGKELGDTININGTDELHPGFDLQDTVFIIRHNDFDNVNEENP